MWPILKSHQPHTDASIPSTAIEVMVHDIEDPHFILVSDVKNTPIILDDINQRLRVIAKKISRQSNYQDKGKLEVGTIAIAHRGNSDGVDMPAWYCRAIVGEFNTSTSKYWTFLPDYGHEILLKRESILALPHNISSIPYVTFVISLNEILPLGKRRADKRKNYETIGQKHWCPDSIDLIRQLMSSSSRCYFNQITIKSNGIKLGELYLIIDNQIVALSKALIIANFAMYITDIVDSDDSTTDTKSRTSDEKEETDELLTSPYDVENAPILRAKRNVYDEILVCSNVECEHFNNINEARFDLKVLKALNEINVKSLRRMQSYIWPAINKGLDVLAVGPPQVGKTIGYAAPISSIIAHNKQYQTDSSYPMVLVLCASSRDGMHIESIFKALLLAHADIKIIGAFNGCTDISLMAKIYSGCRIFISTPAFLIRFLARDDIHRKQLKFDSISHLVIDNLDILLDKHAQSLTQLLGKYTLIGKQHSKNSNMLALQIVGAAQHWTSSIGQFIKILKNPYICVGSFAEAALFSGVQLRPRMVYGHQKTRILAKILEAHYRMVKTIIICANDDEAEELNKFLAKTIQFLYVNSKMKFTEIHGIKEIWDTNVAGNYQVLICTDVVLPNLQITDATWLIHYSIAVPTKSAFLFRFSTLMSNLKSNSRKVEVTIFIDDTNDKQFHGIMDLIKRSGYKLGEKQLLAAEQIRMTLERNKKGHPICNSVKALGRCPKNSKCLYRHCVLEDVDKPMTLISAGDRIILKITYVHNATHFSARILEYIDVNNEKHELSEIEHIKIVNKVYTYYSKKKNRRVCSEVKIGGIYAFEESLDQYQRVQIINIKTRDQNDAADVVDLRCIDTGNVLKDIKASRLRQVPQELAEAPAYIVEIFLANVSPFDDEDEWSIEANKSVVRWFGEQLKPSTTFLQGKVCLHLGNTLWVDPLEIRTKITGRNPIVSDSLTRFLVKREHGIKNIEHMVLMRQLCVNAEMHFENVDD